MIKRLLIVSVLATMILSGCSGQGQAPTETLAPASTETQAPIATEAPATEPPAVTDAVIPITSDATATATPTSSPTSGPPRPTNVPGCTNSASFVADVTFPDNTEVEGGSTFVKTWRIANTGTCIWGPDYTLTPYSDERMGAPASVPLGITYPGQTLDISISLTATNSIGTHRGNFVIKNPAGLIMKVNEDSRLWLIISVKNIAAPTAPATASPGTASQAAITSVSPSGSGLANVTCGFTIDQAKLSDVINGINNYRAQNGLPAYTVNSQLARAAQAHANDMACNNLFVHTGSNGSTPQTRIAASGYIASFSTENVYGSYPPLTGQGAVDWWKNDKTDLNHNRNLISDTYVDIGVGYTFFNNFGYYVVVFATP